MQVKFINSLISDNNMTGITIVGKYNIVEFIGRNVIQNNRNTEGAGIRLLSNVYMTSTTPVASVPT